MVRGVIFDLDGVIADTEPLQWQAYRRVLGELGVDVGLEEYRRHWIAGGFGPEYACRTYALPIGPDELRARKAPVYAALLRAGVAPCPGALDALRRLRPTHRLGLATNSARAEVSFILERLGAAALLHATIAREDYPSSKPAPTPTSPRRLPSGSRRGSARWWRTPSAGCAPRSPPGRAPSPCRAT